MRVIHPSEYYHESDKKALELLKEVPGFDAALKAFFKVFNEQVIHGLNMARKIRLGPEQLPDIYNLLPPICKCLGIEEPELYLEMNPMPNAYTFGDSKIYITLTSGLIECVQEDELKAVIAHECGHIACRHVLYHSMAQIILEHGLEILNLEAATLPLKLAFHHWERCSELSCDRAAAIYTQGSESVVALLMRLAGGGKEISSKINKELYLKQAHEYEDTILNGSLLNKTMQYYLLLEKDHPYLAVRASEIDKWCKTDTFKRIISYANQPGTVCPHCSAFAEETWNFCKKCGKKLD